MKTSPNQCPLFVIVEDTEITIEQITRLLKKFGFTGRIMVAKTLAEWQHIFQTETSIEVIAWDDKLKEGVSTVDEGLIQVACLKYPRCLMIAISENRGEEQMNAGCVLNLGKSLHHEPFLEFLKKNNFPVNNPERVTA